MKRRRPFLSPERRSIPRRVRAEIMLRQEGRCADCRTRLIIGFFVFDHRPPLALRDEADDPNDPDRLAAICWTCDEQKTPKDLKAIARSETPRRRASGLHRAPARKGSRAPSTVSAAVATANARPGSGLARVNSCDMRDILSIRCPLRVVACRLAALMC